MSCRQMRKKHLLAFDHDGGYVMVFSCIAASGPKQLAIVVGTKNLKLYQDILQENIKVAVHRLKFNKSWMIQQDSDPNPTTEWFEKKKCTLWIDQFGVQTLIQSGYYDMIWRGLFMQEIPEILMNWNRFVRRNLKILPYWHASLINSYRKYLVEFIVSRGGSTNH